MRYIMTIFMSVISGLVLAQATSGITEIALSKVSRGYEEHIRITPDSLHVFVEDKMGQKPVKDFSRKVSEQEWAKLVEAIGTRSASELRDLPSPTMKRAHDAAMHSTITMHMDGTTVTHGYDDENPNSLFIPLLKEIRALSSVPGKP